MIKRTKTISILSDLEVDVVFYYHEQEFNIRGHIEIIDIIHKGESITELICADHFEELEERLYDEYTDYLNDPSEN